MATRTGAEADGEAAAAVSDAVGLRPEPFRYALAWVAYQLHANPAWPNALAPENEVRGWLRRALETYEGTKRPLHREQADLVLRTARDLSGFFLARGEQVYGFIHRSF